MKPGERVDDPKIELVPLGNISGQVLDRDDDPIQKARVTLLRFYVTSGRRILRADEVAMTDDQGNFRIAILKPGQYFVKAEQIKDPVPTSVQSPTEGKESYLPTYFPQGREFSQAEALAVSPGGSGLAWLPKRCRRRRCFPNFGRWAARVSGRCGGIAGRKFREIDSSRQPKYRRRDCRPIDWCRGTRGDSDFNGWGKRFPDKSPMARMCPRGKRFWSWPHQNLNFSRSRARSRPCDPVNIYCSHGRMPTRNSRRYRNSARSS